MTENGLDVSETAWNAIRDVLHPLADLRVVKARLTQALEAARRIPPADNAVAVKALEWVQTAFTPRASPEWRADHAFGFYVIECTRLVGQYFVPQLPGQTFDALDEAKAAAQADYETRIRSALEPSPSYAEGRAAGLREAAKVLRTLIDSYVEEHGSYDPETGATEFPGNGDEYVAGLEEQIEAIEALIGAAL